MTHPRHAASGCWGSVVPCNACVLEHCVWLKAVVASTSPAALWRDGTGPSDPPLQGLQYQTLAAGEVESLLSRARGLVMVQLVVGWDAGVPQPVYNPLLLHSLGRALRDADVSIFMSKAAGGLGLTAILCAKAEPWRAWGAHLAGFGAQAALVADSAYYKLLIGRMLGYKEGHIHAHIQATSGRLQPTPEVVAAVDKDMAKISRKKPQLPWSASSAAGGSKAGGSKAGGRKQQQPQQQQQQQLPRKLLEASVQRFTLQAAIDTYDEGSSGGMALPYMQRRSAVLELLAHGQLLFVLTNSGLCSVHHMGVSRTRRLGYLNAGPHDVIRSIVFNECDSSILAVSFHSTDMAFPNQLHCRSVPAHSSSFTNNTSSSSSSSAGPWCIAAGMAICEPVAFPGFVEFDEAAHRALLLNVATMQYKVYDLSSPSYSLLYCLPAAGVTDVKLGSSYLLLVREAQRQQRQQQQQQQQQMKDGTGHLLLVREAQQQQQQQQEEDENKGDRCGVSTMVLPLQVLSAVNGMLLRRHELATPPGSQPTLEVLELFGDNLLLKQPLAPFKIYNVLSLALQACSSHESLSSVSSFLHLQQQQLFMTISYHTLTTWNFKAQAVATFEDHELFYPDARHDALVYVSSDWVASYCRPKGSSSLLPAAGAVGAIHLSSPATGRLIAKVTASQPAADDSAEDAETELQQRLLVPQQQQQGGWTLGKAAAAGELSAQTALADVTALLYDEHQHVIYTGSTAGVVHKWAPGVS
ncbi:hypothetical protein OEZ85_013371 [Tetradesmus obliquus]|uniref:CNH domain-containing protein n=1 Tax=Tetradesmus obliquus TaxID=3088 RepID=A0ABY8U5I8_TETOB|nr:hypothetical protein OEZ85_013371 [Tetradesmus obliquus]